MNTTTSCNVCLGIVGLIDADANMTNATVAALSKVVLTACAILGGRIIDGECKAIVNSIDKIVTWLANGVSRTHVCEKLGLC